MANRNKFINGSSLDRKGLFNTSHIAAISDAGDYTGRLIWLNPDFYFIDAV